MTKSCHSEGSINLSPKNLNNKEILCLRAGRFARLRFAQYDVTNPLFSLVRGHHRAFTFAEIVIVMMAVAVIAGATLTITRQKLANAISAYYYSAYISLNTVVKELLMDTSALEGNLCAQLESKFNIITQDCTAIPATLTTRTGAVLTMNNNIAPISQLNNSSGWIINIDVDGKRGKGLSYVDVFPFYVTTDGKVVPAYQTTPPAGANETKHLAVSVKYDTFPSNIRQTGWLLKSISFQEAACKSGYVSGTYCGSITKNAACTEQADCRIVPLKPGILKR